MKYGNINKNQAKGVQTKNLARKSKKKQQTTISHLFQVPRFLGLRGGRKARHGFFWRFLAVFALKVGVWNPHFPWGFQFGAFKKQTALQACEELIKLHLTSLHSQPSAPLRGPKKRSIEVRPNLRKVDVVIWDGSGLSEVGQPKKGFTCLRVMNFWWCYRIPILYCNCILGVADFEPYSLFHVSLNNQDFFRLLVLLFT